MALGPAHHARGHPLPLDLIFDVRGRLGFARARRALTTSGCYFPVSFKGAAILDALSTRRSTGQRVRIALAPERPANLERIAAMMASGELRAARNRTFTLGDGAAAHQYAEDGHKSGHIALVV